jgi:hypothetical protein
VTERLAEDWLRKLIDEARRGTLPGMVRTGVTFADAAAEWLRYIEHDRMRKPSTISTYRSLLGSRILPAFGSMPIESVTSEMIESWIASVDRTAATRVKLLAMVHGIFQRARKVWGLKVNPAVDVEKPPLSRQRRCGLWCAPLRLSRTRRSSNAERSCEAAARRERGLRAAVPGVQPTTTGSGPGGGPSGLSRVSFVDDRAVADRGYTDGVLVLGELVDDAVGADPK